MSKTTPEKSKYSYEFTDTFQGEANYSWVERGTVEAPDIDSAFRMAKKSLRLSGIRGKKESYGDMIRFRPYRSATVIFVNCVY